MTDLTDRVGGDAPDPDEQTHHPPEQAARDDDGSDDATSGTHTPDDDRTPLTTDAEAQVDDSVVEPGNT